MISLLALIVLSVVNYLVLPIIFQLILISTRATLPLIRSVLVDYVIPYMENRVQDSFISNNTIINRFADWLNPNEPFKLY